jgi:ABC-type lipopolysaccharide export system ATPase subunit
VVYDLVERGRTFGGTQDYRAYLSAKVNLGPVVGDLSVIFTVMALAALVVVVRLAGRDRAVAALLSLLAVVVALAYSWLLEVPTAYFRMAYYLPLALVPLVALALVSLLPPRRAAAAAGIALVPEERQRQGLLFNLSIRHNLVLPNETVKGDVLVNTTRERRDAQSLVDTWRIKAAGVEVPPDALSGGNQQKVVVAKWLATSPKVLLLDEPTKGVDVGAKFEIHEIIRREAGRGAGCLVVSSDLPEVLALADRIIVMREGQIQGQIAGADATEESVMQLATHEGAA